MSARPASIASVISWRSLKTRVTLLFVAIFVISIWSLAFYVSRMLREDMLNMLGAQQFATVSIVATDIDQELVDRLKALEAVAGKIHPGLLGNPDALQIFLEDRPALLAMFNAGLAVMDFNGTAIASLPVSVGRVGVNYMERDYIAAALNEGRSSVSQPTIAKLLKTPVFGIAAPIRDVRGKVIGVLGGLIDLGKPNFLDRITQHSYGETGGYALIAARHRVIVNATDKTRIMQPVPNPGINPLFDRYMQGYEGSGTVVDSRGLEVLSSAKKIPAADWILVARIPVEEVFAPVREMRQRMLLAASVLTLLAGALTWWMMRRQLAPLLAAVNALAAMSDADHPPQPLPIARQDEIGELIARFNRQMAELEQRKALLRQVFDASSVAMFLVDTQGRVTQANQRMADMFGYALDALLGIEYADLVEPAQREVARRNVLELLASAVPVVDVERLYLRADHSEFWGHLVGRRLYGANGAQRGIVAVIEDITERKQTAAALLESEKLRIGEQAAALEAQRQGRLAALNLMVDAVAARSRVEATAAALQASEARSRSITQSAYEAIITSDSAGNIAGWNRGAGIIFGYTEAQAMGQPMTLLMPERYRERHLDGMSRLRSGEEPHLEGKRVELHGLRQDGGEFPLELTLARWESAEGRFVTAIIVDITERKRAEAQVTEQFDELRRWQQMTLGREGRVAAVKKEVNALLAERGLPPRYMSVLHEEPEK